MAHELISRQAAKDALLGWDYDPSDDDLEFAIDNIPAVDAVPVVRCKDCRSCYEGPDDYCCTNHKGLVAIMPLSFCSYGERREENAFD